MSPVNAMTFQHNEALCLGLLHNGHTIVFPMFQAQNLLYETLSFSRECGKKW